MLFMVMHKINEEIASGAPPRKSLIADMGNLMQETIASGRFHNAAGLRGPETRVRVKFAGGKATTQRGPLSGDNELAAGLAMLKVKTLDEAVSWATRLGHALGDVEVDVGPVTEAWDIGVAPKPEGEIPLRVIALHKATAAYEAGTGRSAEHAAGLRAVIEEMKQAGVLLAAEELKPSSVGSRLRAAGGKHTWIDGPFAESKELVSGFTIIKADSKDEAQAWTKRYANILGDCEVDVRQVLEG